METIKNYLDSMFANMPNTAEVRNAKSELLQMMEDKYNELIAEGQSENMAVATVISEFGNLDELAEDLGVKEQLDEAHGKESETPRRYISIEEAKSYLANRSKKSLFMALGVMLCIVSVASPILLSSCGQPQLGAALMFVIIALGVGALVFNSFIDSDWKFIKREPCKIDMSTATYVKERRRSFEAVRAICITIGIILCIVCWVPNIFANQFIPTLGASLMFLLVGIGVFLIVYANGYTTGFDTLLKLNDTVVFSSKSDSTKTYRHSTVKPIKYKSPTAEAIVNMYWPTVTCIYLIISFLTFRWDITWIIWPIAGIAHRTVVMYCSADDEY